MANEAKLGSARKPLKLALAGTRGIPACYGGFETFAEELAVRLAQRGHDVVVYGRRHLIKYDKPCYKDVKIRLLPAPQHKYLETPVHTLLCLLDLVRHPVDAVLVCNAANSPFLWIPRLRRIPVAVNLDGIERLRAKWNIVGRWWYRFGEICSVLLANQMVADAEVIREYYLENYGEQALVIRYGHQQGSSEVIREKLTNAGEIQAFAAQALFNELNIVPGRYILYVSRLEPENNAHLVIKAYNGLSEEYRSMPLVIVGDAPYAREYIAGLKRSAGPNVRFAGYRFGEQYHLLQMGAYLYIQATEVGGTHPALVEAMGFANCVIANETPENCEVVADAGLFYAKNDSECLRGELERVLADETVVLDYRKRALKRASDEFEWEKITSDYEQLFYSLVR